MKKRLIVYFSLTDTTKKFAQELCELVDGDLIPIEPLHPYPLDQKEIEKIAYMEKKRDDRPAIKDPLPSIQDYDFIFIGYPIWWYTFPQIIKTFLDSYDFHHKTIIPFNTHDGSGDEGTYKELQDYVPEAKVLIGLPIRAANMIYDQKGNIIEWLGSLKI